MFNVGSGEFLIILLVALVVLGPQRLPEALRQVGRFIGEAKKLSTNFQNEVQDAMKDPVKKVTGEEMPKIPKIPRTGKELVGFAVPEPFATQEPTPKPEADTGDTGDAADTGDTGEAEDAAANVDGDTASPATGADAVDAQPSVEEEITSQSDDDDADGDSDSVGSDGPDASIAAATPAVPTKVEPAQLPKVGGYGEIGPLPSSLGAKNGNSNGSSTDHAPGSVDDPEQTEEDDVPMFGDR